MISIGKNFFVVFCLILLIFSGLFLFLHHKDTLKNYVPKEVSIYIHTYPQEINSLFDKYFEIKSVFLELFENNSNIEELIKLANREIAIIKPVNQGYRILTYKTPVLEAALKDNKINFQTCGKVLIFPETNNICEQQPKLDFRPKIFNFSKVIIYFTGKEPLFLPDFIDHNYITPFYAYMSWPNQKAGSVFIETNIKGDLMTVNVDNQSYSVNLLNVPRFELYNFDLSKLTFKASIIPENFKYQLLQNFSQVNYFADFDDKFILVVGGLNLKDIQTVIKKRLAFLLPQERKKILPDNTVAINLIANPAYWDFENNRGIWELNEPQLGLKLQVKQLESGVLITNNIDINSVKVGNFEPVNDCDQAASKFIYHYNLLKIYIANEENIKICLN